MSDYYMSAENKIVPVEDKCNICPFNPFRDDEDEDS